MTLNGRRVVTHGVNGQVKLVSCGPPVQDLLIRTQLLPALDVYASDAAALSSF